MDGIRVPLSVCDRCLDGFESPSTQGLTGARFFPDFAKLVRKLQLIRFIGQVLQIQRIKIGPHHSRRVGQVDDSRGKQLVDDKILATQDTNREPKLFRRDRNAFTTISSPKRSQLFHHSHVRFVMFPAVAREPATISFAQVTVWPHFSPQSGQQQLIRGVHQVDPRRNALVWRSVLRQGRFQSGWRYQVSHNVAECMGCRLPIG